MPHYQLLLHTSKPHSKKNKSHGRNHGKMDRRRLKTGDHSFIVINIRGLAIPLINVIDYMGFLAQLTEFRTREGEDKDLPGRLITPGLKVKNNKVLLRHQH